MLLPYAELHCLTNFSFQRGASHPAELVERAHTAGYQALAITDECSLAGVVRAFEAAREAGLKLIIGTEITLADGPKLVLLATDREGYGNLSALITRGRRAAEKGQYRLAMADLEDGVEGCLALLVPSSAHGSPGRPHLPVGAASAAMQPDALRERPIAAEAAPTGFVRRQEEEQLRHARWLAARFPGRCWLAVELHRGPDDAARLHALLALAAAAGIPAVAAGDVHMHVRARRPLQDLLTAVRIGVPVDEAGLALFPNGERHLRSRAELARLYPPQLLAETLRIAERCSFSLDELRYEYPQEIVPPGETPATHLRKLCEAGYAWRLTDIARLGLDPAAKAQQLRDQIEHEIALIAELKYEAYFLTVHDIVAWARGQGILCQGRGSAANSAVCYVLGVTEVDPWRANLLFERFISKERNEPPDIDVDFEHERREEVIQYIYGKYGRDRAALTATVICYRTRSALRDASRALGFDEDQIDRLARNLAWWDRREELPQRLAEIGLDPRSPRLRKLLKLTGMLMGFPRHLSQHVGGFVISRGPLLRLVPIENAAMPERSVIQWDKDDLDTLGLLKVDVLALGMLTAIRKTLEQVNGWRETPLTVGTIPPEDPAVYEMIGHADTVGVFQVESRAQMTMLPRLKPRCYYDLVIEVAIVRPGPIQGGMVHPYLENRHKDPALIHYPSEALRPVLERTRGVPIFQEQVMQLAMVAAGFTAGEADQLRRSMAAWRRKGGLEKFERKLIDGMQARGYSEEYAQRIYEQICGFGEYGFPESHAASFALLVYVSAWLKCHHPAAFLCGLLNSLPMGFYLPAQLIQDAQRHEVQVLPADVTVSGWDCALEATAPATGDSPSPATPDSLSPLWERAGVRGGRVASFSTAAPSPLSSPTRGEGEMPLPAARLGLRLIDGLSKDVGQRIAAARAQAPFASVDDLAHRARLDQGDLKRLAAAGALASLAGHRRQAYWQAAGAQPLPQVLAGAPIHEPQLALPAPSESQDLIADYAALGFTLGRHPLTLLRDQLAALRFVPAAEVNGYPDRKLARTAGLVTCRQRPGTASGTVFVTLEDETGITNIIVHGELVEKQRRELIGSRLLGIYGQVQRQGEVVHVIAKRLVDRTDLLGRLATRSRDFH